MSFGSVMSGLAVGAGRTMIAGANYDQQLAQTEDIKAQTAMRQMSALTMKQELDDKKATSEDVKAGMAAVAGGINSQEAALKGARNAFQIAAGKGNFAEMKVMEGLIKGIETDVKEQKDAQFADTAAKAEAAGRVAESYMTNPTPAAAAEVVRAALAAGEKPENIPPSTDQKAFDRFVQALPVKAMSVDKIATLKQTKEKADLDREEKVREHKQAEADRQQRERDTVAAREQTDQTHRLIAAGLAAQRARDAEARAERAAEKKAAAEGSHAKIGAIEQKVSDTIIRNTAQGTRVLENMLSVPTSAVNSIFSGIKDGTLTEALVRTGGNILTNEADQEVTAIGAEMGVIIGQIVTAGSGRAAALPVVQSFQKMTTPQPGDTQHMKLLRIANAAEIMKLELQNITPGATKELEDSRKSQLEFLKKFPATKDVLKLTPLQKGDRTMQQYMELQKTGQGLLAKAQQLPPETAGADNSGLPPGFKKD